MVLTEIDRSWHTLSECVSAPLQYCLSTVCTPLAGSCSSEPVAIKLSSKVAGNEGVPAVTADELPLSPVQAAARKLASKTKVSGFSGTVVVGSRIMVR